MRVLVSGAAGLVGRYIVNSLLAAGHDVVAGGRRPPATGAFMRSVPFIPLLLDPALAQAWAFAGIDAFVHGAFQHVPGRYRGGEGEDPAGFVRANRDGSVRLFREARDAGVRRAVLLSSRAVYDGIGETPPLRETMMPDPKSLYGRVKLDGEQALAALSDRGFVTASLRLTGVYGDLIPNKWDALFSDFAAGRSVLPRAGAEIHGRDVGQAVCLMLERPAAAISGRVFNVSDIVTDHREILALFAAASGIRAALPAAADPASIAIMDTARLRMLGWQPGGPDLLARTIAQLAGEFRGGTRSDGGNQT